MTSRDRVLKALRCEDVDRTPWIPFVGCHAGALIGATAEDVLRREDKMLKGMKEAIKRYDPDGIPVTFDLQIEAEVLGCTLAWAKENPPAVTTHPLANGVKLADLKVPGPNEGRIKLAVSVARKLRKAHPDIALYGLITGPFTLALHLMGTDIFMKMFDQPQEVRELMEFTREVCRAMAGYYIDAGCDVVAVVDPMTSQISADQFAEWVTPSARPVFDYIRSRKTLGSFFVCGHAQQNVVAMCDCKPDNISVDENIPLQYVKEICLPRNVSFGGNMQLTTVLLLGKPADAQKNAIACLEVGGTKGYLLAPGCDLPFAVPPENLEAIPLVVGDAYQREIAKTLSVETAIGGHLDMGEYGEADKVIVDIVTLDSEACAPCQYMVDAVKKVAPEFAGIVVWREHKIKYRESLVFMTSLMVRNVPTICIDGKITFVSRIPPRDELIAAIQRRINEKVRVYIARHKATVYVLCRPDDDTKELEERLDRAKTELGMEVPVRKVTDEAIIGSYGVAPNQLPAVVLARYHLKSTRSLPDVAIVKEWLKDL